MITGPDPVCHRGLSGHASPVAGLRFSVADAPGSDVKNRLLRGDVSVYRRHRDHQVSTEAGNELPFTSALYPMVEAAGTTGSKMRVAFTSVWTGRGPEAY